MSLATPTTQEINDNIIAQLQAALAQRIPLLPKSFLRVLSKTLAAVFVLLYKYGGFIFLQLFVRYATASPTEINGKQVAPLIEWGRLIGVGDPAAATRAELRVEITVLNTLGFLQSGAQLVNSGNGVTYLTIGSVALNADTVMADIRAVADTADTGGAGEIGNLEVGAVVAFANPLAGVAREARVVEQITTGADGEDIEIYRQRVIDRFQKRPQGGALADYAIWGEAPPGIRNVYPYTSECPGQVDVFVEATSTDDGIPTAAQLQEVLDSINAAQDGLASHRPMGALANTFPIDRLAFNVSVSGLIVDDLARVQADITLAVESYFLSREPFLPGLSIPPRLDRITRSAVGGRVDGVVSASGGIFAAATVTRDGAPVEQYGLGLGEKAKVGEITFA